MAKVGIKEVAQEAGVSLSTVSIIDTGEGLECSGKAAVSF